MIGRDERAGLPHMVAQHLPQRGVQQVGGGVVAGGVVATATLHDGLDAVADGDLARTDRSDVRDDVAVGAGVGNLELRSIGADQPGVADLPAALGVERRFAQHDADAVADLRPPDQFAVADDRSDRGCGCGLLVAGERGRYVQFSEEFCFAVVPEVCSLSREFLVRVKQRIEPFDVNGQIPLSRDLLSDLKRHAESVIQNERLETRDLLRRLDRLVNHVMSRLKHRKVVQH